MTALNGSVLLAEVLTPATEEVAVEAEATLIPGGVQDGAFWVGHLHDQPQTWVGGWGAPASRVIYQRASLVELAADDAPTALGLLAVGAVHAALRPLLPAGRVGLLGDDAGAVLVRVYLGHIGVTLTSDLVPQSLDLLVDTTGDVALWGPALAAVVNEGSALVLGAARRWTSDYNFYPDIHRRSLRLVCRTWPALVDPASARAVASIGALAANVVRDENLVRHITAVTSADSDTQGDTWRMLTWGGEA